MSVTKDVGEYDTQLVVTTEVGQQQVQIALVPPTYDTQRQPDMSFSYPNFIHS